MAAPKYQAIGTSTTSSIDNTKRKEVTISSPKLYSQQVDLSDFIGMAPKKKKAISSQLYSIAPKEWGSLNIVKTTPVESKGRIYSWLSDTEKDGSLIVLEIEKFNDGTVSAWIKNR